MMKIIFGGLILLNIYVWPKWTNDLTQWLAFGAVLLVLKGVVKLAKPTCPHCVADAMPAKKGK